MYAFAAIVALRAVQYFEFQMVDVSGEACGGSVGERGKCTESQYILKETI